jgi:hypothetical protein
MKMPFLPRPLGLPLRQGDWGRWVGKYERRRHADYDLYYESQLS